MKSSLAFTNSVAIDAASVGAKKMTVTAGKLFSAVLLLSVLCVPSVFAVPIVLSTADSPINSGSLNQGWWSDSRVQAIGNDNYFSGFLSSTPNTSRGFFSFDLSGVSGLVNSATLNLRLGGSLSPDLIETIGLFDVSTPVSTLHAKGVVDVSIFDDLGSGNSYGSAEIVVGSAQNSIIQISLNEFVRSIFLDIIREHT